MTAPEAPRRRRARSLRRSVAVTFVLVSLLSVVLLGALNLLEARSLLTAGVESRLTSQQAERARAIRLGLDGIENTVSVAAGAGAVTEAMVAFRDAYLALGEATELLDAEQEAELEAYYVDEVLGPFAAAGFPVPPVDEVLPAAPAGRYLQYHYIVTNPLEERGQLVTAPDDESAYGDAHTRYHPMLDRLRTTLGLGDLMLVDGSGAVLYTAEKRVDLGADLTSEAFAGTGIATGLLDQLPGVPAGEVVLIDFEPYFPTQGAAVMFAAAAVRDGTEVIGSLVAEIPVAALDSITTADGAWEAAGLGETGEVYVVGPDLTMRSDSRLWLEDPDAFLAAHEAAGLPDLEATLITTFGSTVGVQSVDTAPVREVLDGRQFVGYTSNYLGRRTLSVAGPVGAEQLSWVIVADVAADEARQPLNTYVRSVLVVAAILVPLMGLIGAVLAGRITRPVAPVLAGAERIARGDLDTPLPELGRNEFGDVARRLDVVARDLKTQREALDAEEREITELLLSALPPRVVDELRSGVRRPGEILDTATIVAVTVDGVLDDAAIDQEEAVDLSAGLSQALEEAAAISQLERVRSSSVQHLFVAGLGEPGYAADRGAAFAARLSGIVAELRERTGVTARFHAGMASGEVVAGLLESESLVYGVFGDPPRVALALAAIAGDGEVLVDPGAAAQLGATWPVAAVADLVDLRGDPIEASLLVAATPTGDDGAERPTPAG